jgi:hypothetical protein
MGLTLSSQSLLDTTYGNGTALWSGMGWSMYQERVRLLSNLFFNRVVSVKPVPY